MSNLNKLLHQLFLFIIVIEVFILTKLFEEDDVNLSYFWIGLINSLLFISLSILSFVLEYYNLVEFEEIDYFIHDMRNYGRRLKYVIGYFDGRRYVRTDRCVVLDDKFGNIVEYIKNDKKFINGKIVYSVRRESSNDIDSYFIIKISENSVRIKHRRLFQSRLHTEIIVNDDTLINWSINTMRNDIESLLDTIDNHYNTMTFTRKSARNI
jgi:hypothetical protein